jgi:glucokinase-like ROK family protein
MVGSAEDWADLVRGHSLLKGDSLLIKRINQMAILRFVQQNEPSSRYDIARACGVSNSTVSTLIAELMEIGIIKTVGEGPSIGGRRPVVLGINEEAGHVIAVDVGSTTITCGRVDLHAKIHDKLTIRASKIPAKSLAATVELVQKVYQQAMAQDSPPILGVGVATAGYVRPSTGLVVSASNLGWRDVDLGREIQAVTGLPTLVGNNANAAALGELYYGAGAGVANFIYVAIGNGIGAGLVLDGQLYLGARNGAGELGHTAVAPDGPPCSCGRVGCLESLASGRAIELMARTSLTDTQPPGAARPRKARITAEVVFRRAQAGDPAAAGIVDTALNYLAIGIGNMVNLINPDQVIIGGGITRSGNYFMEQFLPKIGPRLVPEQNGQVQFALSESNEDSGLRGAATLVIQQLFGAAHSIPGGGDGRASRPSGTKPTVRDLILHY